MKRYSYILISVGLIGAVSISIWAISQFFLPNIIPEEISSLWFLVFALIGVIAALAALKDFLEIFSSRKEETPEFEKTLKSTATKQEKNVIMLEYRIAVLEGVMEWMLRNGKYKEKITPSEMANIDTQALISVRHKFPDAEISFEGRWEDVRG